jgi:hypothetical protein
MPVANPIPPPAPFPEAAALVPFNRPPIHRLRSYSTGHLPLSEPIVNQVTLLRTTIRYPNGDEYIGQVDETGVPHGEGEYTWADGSRYVGTWRYGFKEGFGVYEELSGYRYRGEWRRSEKCGFGTESGMTLDGREYVYEGGFLHNQRHGLGTKNGFIKVKYRYGKRDDDCVIM